jgi:hypothetical protein
VRYLLLTLFLVSCDEISQQQIDEAARIQNRNKGRCESIARSMDAKSEFRKENGNWLCLVYKKTYLDNPWAVFYEDDLGPISRYLLVKDGK